MNHGDELLRLLDEVRDGLLAGGIPKQTLTRLAAVTAKRRNTFADPKLQTVLDEIELRARVELAPNSNKRNGLLYKPLKSNS